MASSLRPFPGSPHSFPYTRYDDATVDRLMQNLREYRPRFIDGKPYKILNMSRIPEYMYNWYNPATETAAPRILACDKADYDKYNKLSLHFSDPARMMARRYDQELSPYEYYQQNYAAVAKYAADHRINEREAIFKLCREATSFRITNMVALIKLFGAQRVLDFSAGWGDRLLGAIAAGVDYTGIDPNEAMHPIYREIIERFGAQDRARVINGCAETVDLDDIEEVDLVATSPPYFDLEIYSDAATQSISQHPQLDAWYNNFLIASILRMWKKIKIGGYLVVIINDSKERDKAFVERMICDLCLHLSDSLRLGCISYAEVSRDRGFRSETFRSPQPMWIWQKIAPIEINPRILTTDITVGSKTVHLIRDDLLPGGTKQRAAAAFSAVEESELVYAGYSEGAGAPAVAIIARSLGKRATIVVNGWKRYAIRAIMFGAHAKFVHGNLDKVREEAAKYATDAGAYLVPFGLSSPEVKAAMTSAIAASSAVTPQRIWLAGGSLTLYDSLRTLYPDAKFMLVQVGKRIWPDQIDSNTQLLVAREKYWEVAIDPPPFAANQYYEAKIWQFLKKDASDGDYVWVVCN